MIITELTKAELQQIIREEITSALGQEIKSEENLLTRKDTAKFLGVTMPTLNAWEKKGYIRATRLGSRVYFNKAKLLNNLNNK